MATREQESWTQLPITLSLSLWKATSLNCWKKPFGFTYQLSVAIEPWGLACGRENLIQSVMWCVWPLGCGGDVNHITWCNSHLMSVCLLHDVTNHADASLALNSRALTGQASDCVAYAKLSHTPMTSCLGPWENCNNVASFKAKCRPCCVFEAESALCLNRHRWLQGTVCDPRNSATCFPEVLTSCLNNWTMNCLLGWSQSRTSGGLWPAQLCKEWRHCLAHLSRGQLHHVSQSRVASQRDESRTSWPCLKLIQGPVAWRTSWLKTKLTRSLLPTSDLWGAVSRSCIATENGGCS